MAGDKPKPKPKVVPLRKWRPPGIRQVPGTNRICPDCGSVMSQQLQCGRCGHGKE